MIVDYAPEAIDSSNAQLTLHCILYAMEVACQWSDADVEALSENNPVRGLAERYRERLSRWDHLPSLEQMYGRLQRGFTCFRPVKTAWIVASNRL